MLAVLIDGLISGTALAALALAFAVVYIPTRIFHVSLGAVFVVAPFVYASLDGGRLQAAVVVAMTVGTTGVLSMAIERWNHRPLADQGASDTTQFVTALGLFMALVQVVVVAWGDDGRFLRLAVDPLIWVGGVAVPRSRVLLGVGSAVIAATCLGVLKWTSLGLRLRAVADNSDEAALRGIDVRRMRLVAFGLSGVMAGGSALLFAFDRGYHAYQGFDMVLLAVVAVIVGGRHSFSGAIVGGILLGLAREGVRAVSSDRWLEAASFLLLAVFLLFRPGGAVGHRTRAEAEWS